jgi:hypothetical protein
VTLLIHKIGTVCILFVGIAIAVAIRMRCSRDRRRIGEDLARHHCRLVAVRMVLGRTRLLGTASYEVDYVDDEGDPAQATCSARRGAITWPDHVFGPPPIEIVTDHLPVYGQNWRG